jgi:hypothetical protein
MTSTPIPERAAPGAGSTASPTARARALFLVAATLSFAASVVLFFGGDETEGIFVGLWVPSILALGTFLAPADGPR